MPFTQEGTPIELRTKGKRIPEWKSDYLGLVGVLQDSPAKSSEPAEDIALVPMGAARLRIASFPVSIGAFGGSSELSSAKNETNRSTSLAPAAFDHWASESRSARSSSARVSGGSGASFSRHASVNAASGRTRICDMTAATA